MIRRRAGLRRALWEVVPLAVVAWIVFHTIRSHFLERYLVPTASMEPTLHGSETDGDVVLVDKTAWWGGQAPEPFDLVVVRNRHVPGGNHIVKRFVARGPATVWIREGELFVGALGDPSGPMLAKDPGAGRVPRLTAFAIDDVDLDRVVVDEQLREDPGVWRREGRALVIRAVDGATLRAARTPRARGERVRSGEFHLPAHLGTRRAIDNSFMNRVGRRLGGKGFPRDIGIEVTVSLSSAVAAVHLVVEGPGNYYGVDNDRDGRGTFTVMGAAHGPHFAGPALPDDAEVRLAWGYLDGRFFLEVAGEVVHVRPYVVPYRLPRVEDVGGPGARLAPPNLLHLGLAGTGTATARVTRLRAFHDVHYRPNGSDPVDQFVLENGQLFLLGDNAFDSSDSRDHASDPYRAKDLVGRPLAVIGPFGRARRL